MMRELVPALLLWLRCDGFSPSFLLLTLAAVSPVLPETQQQSRLRNTVITDERIVHASIPMHASTAGRRSLTNAPPVGVSIANALVLAELAEKLTTAYFDDFPSARPLARQTSPLLLAALASHSVGGSASAPAACLPACLPVWLAGAVVSLSAVPREETGARFRCSAATLSSVSPSASTYRRAAFRQLLGPQASQPVSQSVDCRARGLVRAG